MTAFAELDAHNPEDMSAPETIAAPQESLDTGRRPDSLTLGHGGVLLGESGDWTSPACHDRFPPQGFCRTFSTLLEHPGGDRERCNVSSGRTARVKGSPQEGPDSGR
jgi:hypothetical protein